VRVKLKYTLPLSQMALAVVLLWWSQVWFKAVMRTADMPGPPPAFTLLIAINAPLALPRLLCIRHIFYPWDNVTLIAAVGLLWYWVALNTDSWRTHKAVFMFKRKSQRLVGDLALIALGAFWGFICVQDGLTARSFFDGSRFGLFHAWMRTPFLVAVAVCSLAWSLALIYFFGRDLIQCVYGNNPPNQ